MAAAIRRWSEGVVIDDEYSTVSKYVIKTIDNQDYMFVEWKSGDYSFGGFVDLYYVFKRV